MFNPELQYNTLEQHKVYNSVKNYNFCDKPLKMHIQLSDKLERHTP
jgi:hypothetical protein